MKILIYGQRIKNKHVEVVSSLLRLLHKRKHAVYIFDKYYTQLQDHKLLSRGEEKISSHKELLELQPDFVFSLGGDGTILNSITLVRDSGISIVGINLGRLGFLATIDKKMIEQAVDQLERGMYSKDERSLIYLESSESLFGETPFALNDFTLHKRDTSSMVVIHAYINGDFLNSYWVDGIILSTPTGSTGYSLSCGGPIVFPNSSNFVLTPVAPHNLNVRPIIISDSSVVSFEIEGRSASFLATLDSRYETITSSISLAVRKSDFKIKLIQLHDMTFLKTMREKLTWGVDTRN